MFVSWCKATLVSTLVVATSSAGVQPPLPKYYKVVEETMTVIEAYEFAPDGCVLASIESELEAAVVAEQAHFVDKECWVGIATNIQAGDPASVAGWFNIMDGTWVPATNSIWKQDQTYPEPNNSVGAQVVATVNFQGSLKLRDVQFTDSMPCAIYVCEPPNTPYYVTEELDMDFEQAFMRYIGPDCSLAPITSVEQAALVAAEAAKSVGKQCWVGVQTSIEAEDPASINGWTNIVDWSPVPATNEIWKQDGAYPEPNNSVGAQTMATINFQDSGRLRDVQATDVFPCAIYQCIPTFPVFLADNSVTYSKRGNRRACAWDRCPSAGINWNVHPCDCDDGLNGCYLEGDPTDVQNFQKVELTPLRDEPTVFSMKADGELMPLGVGSDTASGHTCFDDDLRGGFQIDLTGTPYYFVDRTTVTVSGWSPVMRVRTDNMDEAVEVSTVAASDTISVSVPEGAQKLTVNCGGWSGGCQSELYVSRT